MEERLQKTAESYIDGSAVKKDWATPNIILISNSIIESKSNANPFEASTESGPAS